MVLIVVADRACGRGSGRFKNGTGGCAEGDRESLIGLYGLVTYYVDGDGLAGFTCLERHDAGGERAAIEICGRCRIGAAAAHRPGGGAGPACISVADDAEGVGGPATVALGKIETAGSNSNDGRFWMWRIGGVSGCTGIRDPSIGGKVIISPLAINKMKDYLVLTVAVEILEDGPCFGDRVVEEVVPVWGWVGGCWAVMPVSVGLAILGEKQGDGGNATKGDLGNVNIQKLDWKSGSFRCVRGRWIRC